MTDRLPRTDARDLRRWPSDPAQLVDTTRCPACFSPLYSARCMGCGLDLGVPESIELLAASTRVYEEEERRQQLITQMREAQAAREAGRATTAASVAAAAIAAAVQTPAPAPAGVAPVMPSAPPIPVASQPAAAPVAAPPAPPAAPATPPAPSPAGRRRSGVQVLLLTLGVVLISVTAIVFLFVAYLVASLEVRSAIIAGASVLVLGVAWLLRARRLPGTAEGVAAVAVVLLLLDVWIVRENGLFGTDVLNTAAYTGVAFAIMAGLLAATRAASGIRVPGFAAAGLAPIAVFLLGYSIDPETATGVWFGGLAATVVGAVAVAVAPRTSERTIMLSAGFAGGVVSLGSAFWALPDVRWNESLTFLAVAAACLLIVVATHVARADVAPEWGPAAAIGVGIAAALSPAVGIAAELDPGFAIWLAPASAGAIAAVAAGVSRRPAPVGGEARAALIASAAVAAAAAVPGLLVGLAVIGWRLLASIPAWQVAADERVPTHPQDLDLGTMLVPFVVAAGATTVLLLLGSLRRFAAVPIGAVMIGALVVGAIAPGAAVPAAVFVVVGAGALTVASTRVPVGIAGLLPTLAVFGIGGAGLAVWTAYSNSAVWPWTITAVLASTIAGRLLARRVWSARTASALGPAHLVVAMLLAATAVFTIPLWLDASGAVLAAPWDSPWMWLGTMGAGLLAVALFLPRISDADRIGLVVPALTATATAAFAAAFDEGAMLQWLPAALLAAVIIAALRTSLPTLVRVLLAAAGPVVLALAFERTLAAIPGAPPAVLGAAAAVLLAAGLASLVISREARAARIVWCVSLGVAGLVALGGLTAAGDQRWLLLVLLTPVPLLVASLDGDPIGGSASSRHLSWLTIPLAVGAVWTWLAGDGVDEVEAYTLPLAASLAAAGALITWSRLVTSEHAAGRTALFAAAATVAVLPSVASSGDAELRTIVLVAAGAVVAIAAAFLPETARGVPVRLLGVATGWVALTGAALVRGSAVARGETSMLPVEFWPALALAAGAVIAVTWARAGSRPAIMGESLLAASVIAASVPTVLAIVSGEQPLLRAAVLFPLLAAAHIAGAASTARPIAGPIFAWSTLGVLVLGGLVVLVPGEIDPFDVVTASVGVALVGAGAFRMLRSPALGSWPALGPGLAVLMIPALIADFTDPELWRIIALGVVAALAVVVGAVRRLQAPLLVGSAVLLVHAIAQLWPWITWLYEAVWWWLWLGIAGVILVVLAATYERQLRLARGTIRSIASLR